jgi:penicillin amidase
MIVLRTHTRISKIQREWCCAHTCDCALTSLTAAAVLEKELGADVATWTWGSVHRTRPRHPLSQVFPEWAALLDPPGHAVHGDADTPLANGFSGFGSFTAAHMSVNRYIFDPSEDWANCRWIVPGGASGHPGSPHYADQAPLHADVKYIPMRWDWTRIQDEAESVQHLQPE